MHHSSDFFISAILPDLKRRHREKDEARCEIRKRKRSKLKGMEKKKKKKGQTRVNKQIQAGIESKNLRIQTGQEWTHKTQRKEGSTQTVYRFVAPRSSSQLSPYSDAVQSVTRLSSRRLQVKSSTGCFWRGTTAASTTQTDVCTPLKFPK